MRFHTGIYIKFSPAFHLQCNNWRSPSRRPLPWWETLLTSLFFRDLCLIRDKPTVILSLYFHISFWCLCIWYIRHEVMLLSRFLCLPVDSSLTECVLFKYFYASSNYWDGFPRKKYRCHPACVEKTPRKFTVWGKIPQKQGRWYLTVYLHDSCIPSLSYLFISNPSI